MDIGSRLSELINKTNTNSNRVAKSVGMSPSYLSAIERGEKKPTLDMLEKICSVLNITLQDFFNVDSELNPELQRLIENAKDLPEDILEGINSTMESINGHFKTVEKSINGIKTKYTVDLNVKPNGLTEEEEIEAQRLIRRLKELDKEK